VASLFGCINSPSVKSKLAGEALPSFNLLLIDSVTGFNTNNIPSGNAIVLYYFTPVCPFCRAQTEEIITEMKSLANIRFYFLTTFPFGKLKRYYDHYELKKYPNITVGQDYKYYFENHFKAQQVPYMVIYNKNKQLKNVVIGKVNISVIKKLALE
jgi:thiol-disulfide isomerase/thioredoxin